MSYFWHVCCLSMIMACLYSSAILAQKSNRHHEFGRMMSTIETHETVLDFDGDGKSDLFRKFDGDGRVVEYKQIFSDGTVEHFELSSDYRKETTTYTQNNGVSL